MKFKKKYIYILLCLLNINILKSDEFDDAIDQATSEADASKELVHIKKDLTYIDVLNQILAVEINDILAKDLYKKTNTVLKRPLLTLPIFILYHTDHVCQDWLFKFFIFGNATNRAFFDNSSPFITSYINLESKELEKIIENFAPEAKSIINLVKKTKKQERRAGIMFQSLMNFNQFSFEIDLPLFYEERNYFFTQREKEALEEAFGNKPEKQEEKELRKHAVADQFGFGDARIKIGYPLIQRDNICLKAGLQSTIPTAFAFKKGLLGSNFMKATEKPLPIFDFKRLFELVDDNNKQELSKLAKEFGIPALDWLSAMVLEDPLGNRGHFGLGAFIEPKVKLNEGVSLKALGSIEYFFPGKEKRFFLKIKDKNAFAEATLKKDLDNEQDAKKAVNFLNQQVLETVFPPIFNADITPGFIAQVTLGPQFKLNEWHFSFGYDFWYQSQEKISGIQYKNPCDLNVKKALKDKASSSKLFASLSYSRLKPDKDWAFMFNFEDVITTKGVGRDFSVAVGFEFNY